MKNIFLDLRGQALAVLIVEDKNVVYRTFIDRFSISEPEQAAGFFSRISQESGIKLGKAHLILPAEAITLSIHRVPPMSHADTEKVIRRKIAKDTGTENPIYRFTQLAAVGDKQTYIVETIDRAALSAIVSFFKNHGIIIKTATSALQANIRALAGSSRDAVQHTALIDLGRSHIEFTVLTDSQIFFHERVPVAAVADRGAESSMAPEQIEKMRVYRTAESVYKAYISYQSAHQDMPVDSILISGINHSLTGIEDALKEFTGVAVSKLNLLDDGRKDGPVYTALYGLAQSIDDADAVNFLPKDLAAPALPFSRPVRITAALIAAVVLIISATVMETKYRRAATLLESRRQEIASKEATLHESAVYIQHRDALITMAKSEPAFYPILGYLADQTPDDVYIAGLLFNRKSGGTLLEIDFLMPSMTEVGNKKLLSKITAMIDRSNMLKRRGEPSLLVAKQGDVSRFHFKVSCEVLAYENTR